jgi:hypothetical protein
LSPGTRGPGKFGIPPTEAELDQIVKRILAGKSPVDAKT